MEPVGDPMVFDSLFTAILVGVLLVVPLWRIFGRAGFHPAWSLLALLPYAGMLACLIILAFARWPADPLPREVE